MKRMATGSVDDFHNGTHFHCDFHNCTFGTYRDYQVDSQFKIQPWLELGRWMLLFMQSMTLISAYGPLNYAGCFTATLSSAMASYVSCPKLLQAIGNDKIYPHWMVGIWAKGYGVAREPLRAYSFTFVFTLIFILIGNLTLHWNRCINEILHNCFGCYSSLRFRRHGDHWIRVDHLRDVELRYFSNVYNQAHRMATPVQGITSFSIRQINSRTLLICYITVLQHVVECSNSNYLHYHHVHGELANGPRYHRHCRFLLFVYCLS